MKESIVIVFSMLIVMSTITCQAETDRFLNSLIDRDKWKQQEEGIEIVNQKLEISVRTPTPEEETVEKSIRFITSPGTVNRIQANVALGSNTFPAGTIQNLNGQIVGFFYNSSGRDVVAILRLAHSGGSGVVTVQAHVFYWGGNDIGKKDFAMTTGPGNEITLNLDYNIASDLFTFTAGPTSTFPEEAETKIIQGPSVDKDYAEIDYKGLMFQSRNDGDATNIVSTATFDNVEVDGIPYDDFDVPLYTGAPNIFINPANWFQNSALPIGIPSYLRNPWISRRVTDGQIVLTAQNYGLSKVSADQNVADAYISDFLQADITIDSSSFVSGSSPILDRGQVQMYTSVYNDTYNGTTKPYNGSEGAVYPLIILRVYGDNSTTALATMQRCYAPSCPGYSTVFFEKLSCTVTPGTKNTVRIIRKEDTFYFTCDGDTVSYTVKTPIYDGESGKLNRVRARVYTDTSEYGYIKAYVDNVITSKSSMLNYIPVITTAARNK